MQTLNDIAPFIAVGAAALAIVLLALLVVVLLRVNRLRRGQAVVLGHHEQRDIVAHAEDLDAQVRNLREAVELLTDELDEHKRQLDHALTNRAIVRYDAFRDAGGEQSASFALLDQYRSGVVFSAIAARDFARIYVKYIAGGVADRDLSPEEVEAMKLAVPSPLQSGEEGPKARRSPLLDVKPPLRRQDDVAETGEDTAEVAAPRQPAAPTPEAEAAFEALGDVVDPEDAADTAHGEGDDFTWEAPSDRPPAGPGGR